MTQSEIEICTHFQDIRSELRRRSVPSVVYEDKSYEDRILMAIAPATPTESVSTPRLEPSATVLAVKMMQTVRMS